MRRRLPLFVLALVLAIVLDVTTKAWAECVLLRYVPIEVIGDWFRFTLTYNEGVAFGLLATDGPGVIILSSLATLLIAFWVVRVLRMEAGHHPAPWALGLLLGGGLANVIDRIGDGRVTDFLDFGFGAHRWPTFNLADVFILTGAALIMTWSYRHHPTQEPPAEPPNAIRSEEHENELS